MKVGWGKIIIETDQRHVYYGDRKQLVIYCTELLLTIVMQCCVGPFDVILILCLSIHWRSVTIWTFLDIISSVFFLFFMIIKFVFQRLQIWRRVSRLLVKEWKIQISVNFGGMSLVFLWSHLILNFENEFCFKRVAV